VIFDIGTKSQITHGPSGLYIPDLYYKEKELMKEYFPKHGLPVGLHAGTDDTSEVLYVEMVAEHWAPMIASYM
jgi:hypothetical protein